jgi:hypothetical protein
LSAETRDVITQLIDRRELSSAASKAVENGMSQKVVKEDMGMSERETETDGERHVDRDRTFGMSGKRRK